MLDDDRLERCYPNIKSDIDALIEEGWLRIVETQESNVRKTNAEKKRVIFPCDLANTEVEINSIPTNCHKYIQNIWNNQLKEHATSDWEKTLQE